MTRAKPTRTIRPLRDELLTRQALARAGELIAAASSNDVAAMRTLLGLDEPDEPVVIPVGAILEETCRYFDVPAEDVAAGRKYREATVARHVVCYVGTLFGLSFSHIGRQIGRDHSTVLHSTRTVKADDYLLDASMVIANRLGYGAIENGTPTPLTA